MDRFRATLLDPPKFEDIGIEVGAKETANEEGDTGKGGKKEVEEKEEQVKVNTPDQNLKDATKRYKAAGNNRVKVRGGSWSEGWSEATANALYHLPA